MIFGRGVNKNVVIKTVIILVRVFINRIQLTMMCFFAILLANQLVHVQQ